jgi:hypothetical protein
LVFSSCNFTFRPSPARSSRRETYNAPGAQPYIEAPSNSNEAAVVAGEERDHAGDVLHFAAALDRLSLHHVAPERLLVGVDVGGDGRERPGRATALTRIPPGPASRTSARVKPTTAPFDAM